MNINRSYLRGAIIAIVVMIGTISTAYAAPFVISGSISYEDHSECDNPSVSITNQATDEAWAAATNESSNHYQVVLDSTNVSTNDTLRFKATSPDEGQSRTTTHVVTQAEINQSGFVHDITLADAIPPRIHSVVLDPTVVAPNGSISVAVNATDAAGVANVTANGVKLALVDGNWEGTITAESTSGTYSVTVVATDTLSNVAEDNSKTYEVDATSPEIVSVVLDPAVVAPNGSISVAVNATDAAGVASVTANNKPLELVDGTWEGTITAESTSGTYSVTVVATDTLSNVAEDNSKTYEVDATSPEIVSVVLDPAVVAPNGSISVAVNATDAAGVASVTANNKPLELVDGTWEGTITAESAEDTYNVTVVATDAAGNVAEDNSKTYVVDATSPEIVSVVLDPIEVEPNDPIKVTVTVTDESGVASVTANGFSLADAGNDTWIGTITAANASGAHNVTVIATDAANNSKETLAAYTVQEPADITPPEIVSVVLDPIEVEPNDPIKVTVTVTDESGVASVTANGFSLADAGNDTWIGTITAANASGAHNVTVVATDAANNSKETLAAYTVQEPADITPPEIVSVVLDPIEVEPNDPIKVTVTVTDESGVASVTANGFSLADAGNDTWIGTITAANASGAHNVTVIATDAANNSKETLAAYTVQEPADITPPEIVSVVLDPIEVEPNDPIKVTVTVTDESGVASVTANGFSLADAGNDTWIGTITAANASGAHNVTVIATDAANNSKETLAAYTVQEPADITPPEIVAVVLDPIEVEPNDPIKVTVTVTDESGVASVTANGFSLADAGNDTWIGTITAANASGAHNVTVIVTDAANNSKETLAAYTVQEPADITPPEIVSVVLDPIEVEPNDPIKVTVIVTDESGVASVTANGFSLADAGNDTWIGTITAANASGAHNVTVIVTDAANNSKETLAAYTVQEPADITPPEIVSVVLDPIEVEPNDPIKVTVIVTDESGVASVTANGFSLADAGNDTWIGTITAANASGAHNVTVIATDAANNSKETSAAYTVTEPVPPVILHIEDVTVRLGRTETVPITVFDVVDMSGCEITFTYDPAVVYVTDVARGGLNFSFEYNVNNGSGWMRANALDVAGRSGDVIFAYVTLTAVGNESDTSEMEFEYSRLVDSSLGEIAHVRDNGTFTILSNILPEVTNVSATPDTILYDNGRLRASGTNITLLSAHVTDTDGSITTVTIDLSSIGGSPAQPMEHVSEDIWEVTTNAMEVASTAPDFTHQLTITATDNDGGISDSVSIALTVLKRGDVNGDGLVNKMDADYISRYLVGLEPEASNPPSILVGDVVGEAGDPVGNGVVDLVDALYIAKYTSDIGAP